MWQLDTLDVQFQGVPHAIASYILRHGDAIVMLETGPGSTVAGLTAGLAGLGLRPVFIHVEPVVKLHGGWIRGIAGA